MGTADAIPGVSGGTMALICGIYDRLVGSIAIGVDSFLLLVTGKPKLALKRLTHIKWLFVLPLLAGIGMAIVVASHFLPHLIETYPMITSAVFFGLVAASLQAPYKEIGRQLHGRDWVLMLAFCLFAFWLVGLNEAGVVTDPGYVRIFLSAMIAITAMILPGISGAYLLLIMGMYTPTLTALKTLNLPYVLTFAIGCAVGLGGFSKILTWLLTNYRAATMSALLGLMIGSLRALWPYSAGMGFQQGALATACIGLGACVVTGIMAIADRKR